MSGLNPSIRERGIKNALEEVGEYVGLNLGQTGIGKAIASLLGDSGLSRAIASIAAGTVVQAPAGVAHAFAKWTGADQRATQNILNEAIDATLKSLIDSSKGRGGAEPTDEEIRRAAKGAVAGLKDRGNLSVLDPGDRQVVVDAQQHVFHDLACPVCTKPLAPKKEDKGKPSGEERRAFKEGYQPASLRWALQNGYTPTSGMCCNGSVHQTMLAVQRTPRPFQVAITELGREAHEKYEELYRQASPEERGRISALNDELPVSVVRGMVLRSNSMQDLLAQLPKPKVDTGLAATAGKAFAEFTGLLKKALAGDDAALANIRAKGAKLEDKLRIAREDAAAQLALLDSIEGD